MSFEDQDVTNTDSSSENQATETQPSDQSESTESAPAASAAPAEENVPFHKHPRFQELIQERNTFKEQIESQAKVLQDLQKQMQKSTPAERDELMERLEGIDPKFAAMLKTMRDELKASKQQLEDFSQWRNQSTAQSTQQRVESMKTNFYSENKVPKEREAIYEAMVQAEAAKNPRATLNDLPAIMKSVHDNLSKMFTSVERATTKQFVDGKKNEAAKPASLQKGAPAQAKKPEQSLSKSELLAQMKREALNDARSGKDI